MKIQVYIFLFILFSISSCEQYYIVDMPDLNPQFVINGTLEPGKPVDIIITRTKGVLEDINIDWVEIDGVSLAVNYDPVKDAVVRLTVDGQSSYLLTYRERIHNDVLLGAYFNDEIQIEAGRTYELEVSGSGLPTATSKVTVPLPISINSLKFRQGVPDPTFGNFAKQADFFIGFNDPIVRNFYEVQLHIKTVARIEYEGGVWYNEYGFFYEIDPLHPAYQREYVFGKSPHITINDLLFNGGATELGFSVLIYPEESATYDATIYLKHVTEDWYRYRNTLELQRKNGGDPLSQPVQVYTNIRNGLGILRAGAASIVETSIVFD